MNDQLDSLRVAGPGSSLCRIVSRRSAQVTYDRMLRAASEPQNWLTYGGSYTSQRYSLLDQITPANVENLELKWVLQNQVFGAWQSTPLVVDGIMYVTQRPERRARARREDRPGLLALPLHAVARRARLLRRRTTAASRSSATRSSWARSTRT